MITQLPATSRDRLVETRMRWRAQLRRMRTPAPSLTRLQADRAMFDRIGETLPLPQGLHVEPVDAGTKAPLEWLRVPGSRDDQVLLYFHAGGYVMGSAQLGHHGLARFAQAAGVDGLCAGYRLAPEHVFPAALDDALTAYRWLLDSGRPPEQIVVLGESAGGGLALATMVAARDRGWPLPAGVITVSAWTDLSNDRAGDPTRSRPKFADELALYSAWYRGETPATDPLVSPIHADLSGLPPLLLLVGGAELLYDDTVVLAQRARAAGTSAEVVVGERMPHCWTTFSDQLPCGGEGIERVAAWIGSRAPVTA